MARSKSKPQPQLPALGGRRRLPERVVVATDFSAGARRALRRTQYLAFAERAEVVLVHVGPPDHVAIEPSRVDDHVTARLAREATTLRNALSRLDRTDVQVRTVVSAGTPSIALLEVASQERADLIVIGRRGAGNLRKFLMGSTAERVIQASEIPVLVVGPQPAGPYASPVVALADSDGSSFVIDGALRVLPPALRRLDVVTAAYVPMEGWLWGGWTSSKEILRIKAITRKRADAAVRVALAPYTEYGLRPRVTLRDGEPRQVILDEVKRRRADLLTVGTHARAGIVRFRLGSVAAHVIRHAPCDVLVARPPSVVIEEA